MAMTLDELVVEACNRLLSEGELQTLCKQAEQANQRESVLVRLLRARTSAGRTNLASAKALTTGYRTVSHPASMRSDRSAAQEDRRRHNGVLGARLPFALTHHASEQYISRHLPGESMEKAQAFLDREASEAAPLRDKTFSGDSQWIGPSGVIFVVRRDADAVLPVCVTILPRPSGGLAEDQPVRRRRQ